MARKWRRLVGLALAAGISIATTAACPAAAPRVVWVAPEGDDANPGTEARPLRGLEAARDAVRELKKAGEVPVGGIVVRLKEGLYPCRSTLALGAQDSGAEGRPIVYEGVSRGKTVLSGGLSIPGRAFHVLRSGPVFDRLPAEARGKVVAANLAEHGFEGLEPPPGSFEDGGGIPYLFFEDRPMTLARWPNDAYARMGKTLDTGGKFGAKGEAGRGGSFQYEADRPAHWKVDDNMLVRGYLRHDWHHTHYRVAAVDPKRRAIVLARAGRYEVGGKFNSFKGRYIAYNLPEELDRPGEWTIDFRTGEVAFWAPEPLEGRTVDFTFLRNPLIEAREASDIVIRNLTLELGRGLAIDVGDGRRVRFEGCTIRNFDKKAVSFRGGRSHGIEGCEIYGLGQGGVSLWGGDRKTLEPGGHYMVNCDVHDYGRLTRTYSGAAWLGGVGNRLAHCKIHAVPHSAVFYGGNEHVIEYNEMFDLMQETGDAGATYTGRDWTSQGNIVRYNYMHHLGGVGTHGANGVYLDDCDSGDTIHGNIVRFARTGMLMGGGRNNTIVNNIFVECEYGFRADSRGERRMKFNTEGDSWDLERKAEAVNYTQPPWSERYPALARTMEEMPTWPLYNEFARNAIVKCKNPYGFSGMAEKLVYRHDNWTTDDDPGFRDWENGDLALKDDAEIFRKIPGFEKIPYDKIGLLD